MPLMLIHSPRSLLRIATGALLLGSASLAFAHAYPVKQAPGAGSSVSTAQKDVSIEFDDALEPAFSSIAVTDAQGQSVTAEQATVDATDKKHMSVTLKPLAPGVYTVHWVAVADDSHRTQGHYSFTVK
jgi:copper resistance protein C